MRKTSAGDVWALRLVPPHAAPTHSVVLATLRTYGELREALLPLIATCSELGAELLVIGPHCEDVPEGLQGRHVRFLSGPSDATMHHLRALAMSHVAGDIVVLLDDTRAESAAWPARVRTSRTAGDDRIASRHLGEWPTQLNGIVARNQ